MIPVTRLRTGTTFRLDRKPYQVVEYKHTSLGRGQATIRAKVRDLKSGVVEVKAFNSGAKVESIETEVKTLQFLYRDGENFYFMDPITFEQFSLPSRVLVDKAGFLKVGEKVKVLFWQFSPDLASEPLSVEIPNSLVFRVKKTTPGVKGDRVSGATKPATLDNDLVIQTPLFIKEGDKVKVDTKTGEYVGRVRQR